MKKFCIKKFCVNKFILISLIAAMLFSFTGCGKEGTKVVLTTGFAKDQVFIIDNLYCTYPEIMVYLTNVQNQYEEVYGEEIWNASLDGVSLEENVKETVLARIAQVKTMYLMALDRGVELDEKEQALCGQAAEYYYRSLSEEEIATLGVTQELLEEMYREYALSEKVYYSVIEGIAPEISDDEARIVQVQHIFFATSMKDGSGNVIQYSQVSRSEVYQKAHEVYDMAISGEYDFEQLAVTYSEDDEIVLNFGRGEMDPAIEKAAFNLQTNEISGILETDTGYHIIKCISTLNREETDANKLKIVEESRQESFEQVYDSFVNSVVRNLNQELWDSIELIHSPEIKTSSFFEIYGTLFNDET